MTTELQEKQIQEVVAIFFDADSVERTVKDLLRYGIGKKQISVAAGEHAIRKILGDYYHEPTVDDAEPGAPKTAFVAKESVGDTVHGLFGGFFFTGTTLAAGALVATVGLLGSPLLTGIAAGAALGGIGAVSAAQADKNEAEYLREELDRGHLVLFVRLSGPEQEYQIFDILREHSAFEPHLIDVDRQNDTR